MNVLRLKNWIKKYQRLIASISIFLIIFTVLGLAFIPWGFTGDDCSLIFHAKISSWRQFFSLCSFDCIANYGSPSNFIPPEASFLKVSCRPLYLMLYAPQVLLLGGNPCGYFLLMVAFHAIVAVILFNILLFLTGSYAGAWWGALFFGFHASVASWMGWIAAQIYPLSLALILISLIALFHAITRRKFLFYIIAAIFYALALFLFEIVIFFPVTLIALYPLYRIAAKNNVSTPPRTFWQYATRTWPFWTLTGVFLAMRLIAHPIAFSSSPIQLTLQSLIRTMGHYVLRLSYELPGFSIIGSTNSVVKYTFFLVALTFFLYLLLRHERWFLITTTLCAGLFFSWPIMINEPPCRYLYFSIPFFIIGAFFLLFKRICQHRSLVIFCWLFLCFNVSYVTLKMYLREQKHHQFMTAYATLGANKEIAHKPWCFIGLPIEFRESLAQTLWMLSINCNFPIFYDNATFAFSPKKEILDEPLSFSRPHEAVLITPIKNGFRLRSQNPESRWWSYNQKSSLSMGDFVINHQDPIHGLIYDFSYVFDAKFRNQSIIFIAWDYQHGSFNVLAPQRFD